MAKNKSSDKSTMSSADKTETEGPVDNTAESSVDASQDEAVTSPEGLDGDSDASPETPTDAPPADLADQPEGRMPEPDAPEEPELESPLPEADPAETPDDALDEAETSADGQEGGTDTDPTEPLDTALASEEAEPESSSGDMPEPEAEATVTETPPPPPVAEKVIVEKRGGFVPLVLGGVIAAGIGFAAGSTGLLNSVLPASVKEELDSAAAKTADQLAALKATSDKQAAEIESLKSQLTAETADAGASADVDTLKSTTEELSTKLAALEKSVTDLSSKTGPLADRVTQIEQNPSGDEAAKAATEAFKAELAKLSEDVKAQQAALDKQIAQQEDQIKSFAATQDEKIQALVAEAKAAEAKAQELEAAATAAANRAEMRAVVADIGAALDGGEPYTDLLAKLKAGGIDVPDALSGPAEAGVPTISDLRASFPQAARDALAASRQGDGGGLAAFLDRQLQVRSITPKDGTSADAVLSRAQAAINSGELAEAVKLVTSLPEPAKSALKAWESQAQTRLAAVQANTTLAQSLNSN